LIRSLILLAFEQKKLIKKLQSGGNKVFERGNDHNRVKDESRELFKDSTTAAYYNHVINQVKLKDRSEFFTKPIDRDTSFLTKPNDRETTFLTKPMGREPTESRTALGKETGKIFYLITTFSKQSKIIFLNYPTWIMKLKGLNKNR